MKQKGLMEMDANNAMSIVRLLLLGSTVCFFAIIYYKLRFRGFLTLTTGFSISIVVVVLVELKIIQSWALPYQILTVTLAVMYLASAVLIYNALISFQKDNKN